MGSKERFYVDIQTLNSGVTGSCHLCIVKYPNGESTKFIVDCGLFQSKDDENAYNDSFTFNADNIDFALITHNHTDHTARLPLLCKNGFTEKIYTTIPTSKLLPLALYDSYKVLKDTCTRKHTPLIYSNVDVENALSKVSQVPFDTPTNISDNIKVTFLTNGHLVGAALILVEISYESMASINLLFTGDYNSKNMFFDVLPLPERVLELPLTIIQESTYGTMDSSSIQPCFEQNILSAISNGGTVVVPVFSLGRSQEILYILKTYQEAGKLSKDIPIFFDGKLAFRYTDLYLKGQLDIKEGMLDFLPYGLQFVDSSTRGDVLEDTNAKIILTTSGMGSYGPAPQYILRFIGQKNALIQFTGYTAEGTLGSTLKNSPIGKVVKVGGVLTEKYASVEYTTEFSAHAKADEMIAFLQQFQNINLVVVNHGEPEVKEEFAKRVLKEVKTKNVVIAGREIFFRINPYHLVKTLTTKFQ